VGRSKHVEKGDK